MALGAGGSVHVNHLLTLPEHGHQVHLPVFCPIVHGAAQHLMGLVYFHAVT
jgi:hypothetical protein